jgi:DNA-binding NtrC family response regulator
MIGKSPKIKQIFDLVQRVSRSVSNVLITGESGTGKEMVARAIHEQSPRAAMPFVAINCSAIPDHLLESELFGHKKGAFTGAQEARRGLFEEANKGTIFLDEIGDMPIHLQAKLLRVLQEREIRPVGENKSRPIDVRVVAATHKDLRSRVVEGKFREDLYYRLCVVPIQIPPLRDRREDIALFAEYFLKKYCSLNELPEKKFSQAALAKLIHEKWPGNVRELENTIERTVVLSDQKMIDANDIQIEGRIEFQQNAQVLFSKLPTLSELERDYVQYVLSQTECSKEKAAHILGINRKTLYRKEHEHGILTTGKSTDS